MWPSVGFVYASGSILAFYQIRDENRAKLKISYSCGHRVSKSARYDATFMHSNVLMKIHEYAKKGIKRNNNRYKNKITSPFIDKNVLIKIY